MKKQYIRYGAVFCIVVLLAFSIAFVIFTKNKIDDFNLHFNLPFVTANIDYHADNADGQLEEQGDQIHGIHFHHCRQGHFRQ